MLDIAQQLRDKISPELLEKHNVIKRVRNYPHSLAFWGRLPMKTAFAPAEALEFNTGLGNKN